MNLLTLARFEDRADLALVEVHGRPVVVISQLATALEYGDPTDLGQLLTRSGQFLDGEDGIILKGKELTAFKAIAPGLVSANAPALTILFEQGIYLALMLSQQPKAQPFRRWLASEVLPSIRKTGSYTMPASSRPATSATPAALPPALRRVSAGAVFELLEAEASLGRACSELRAELTRSANVQALEKLHHGLKSWLHEIDEFQNPGNEQGAYALDLVKPLRGLLKAASAA